MAVEIPLEAFKSGERSKLAYACWVLHLLLPEWVPAIIQANLGSGRDTDTMFEVAGMIRPTSREAATKIDKAFADLCGGKMSPREAADALGTHWADRFLKAPSADEQIRLLDQADTLHDLTWEIGPTLFAECVYLAGMLGYEDETCSSHDGTLDHARKMVREWLNQSRGNGGDDR